MPATNSIFFSSSSTAGGADHVEDAVPGAVEGVGCADMLANGVGAESGAVDGPAPGFVGVWLTEGDGSDIVGDAAERRGGLPSGRVRLIT